MTRARLWIALGAALPVGLLAAPPALAKHPVHTKHPVHKAVSRVSLTARQTVTLGNSIAIVAGDRIKVRGFVHHRVAGETVKLLIRRSGHVVRRVHLAIHGGSVGFFVYSVRLSRPSRYTLQAVTVPPKSTAPGTASAVGSGSSKPLGVDAVSGGVGDYDTMRALQVGLGQLGFVSGGSGSYDGATQLGVYTYRKVNGMARTTDYNTSILRFVLHGEGGFHVRFPGAGHHVEANLGEQAIALIDPGGHVFRVIPTSSGKPSTPTVLGTFHVYSKDAGTNSHGMFDSNYFVGGYAIHGYPDVPDFPASHGCLRIPNSLAPFVFGWVQLGDEVDVYY